MATTPSSSHQLLVAFLSAVINKFHIRSLHGDHIPPNHFNHNYHTRTSEHADRGKERERGRDVWREADRAQSSKGRGVWGRRVRRGGVPDDGCADRMSSTERKRFV